MIILDIETTGTDPLRNCLVSLGAVDFETGEEFYGECRIYHDSEVHPIALQINGFTEEQIYNPARPPAHELYDCFLVWSERFSDKLIAGHNVGHFDILFLEKLHKILPQETKWPFGYRTLDLHSVAFKVLGKSLSHERICDALGLPVEPKPHNALSGARSERDAFKLLLK